MIIETALSLSMVAELRAIWRAGAGGSRGRFRWPDLFHDPSREAARDFANGTSPLFSFHRVPSVFVAADEILDAGMQRFLRGKDSDL